MTIKLVFIHQHESYLLIKPCFFSGWVGCIRRANRTSQDHIRSHPACHFPMFCHSSMADRMDSHLLRVFSNLDGAGKYGKWWNQHQGREKQRHNNYPLKLMSPRKNEDFEPGSSWQMVWFQMIFLVIKNSFFRFQPFIFGEYYNFTGFQGVFGLPWWGVATIGTMKYPSCFYCLLVLVCFPVCGCAGLTTSI